MLELLNKKYDELKPYLKMNKEENSKELNDKIVSLYCSILGYYSAKLDLGVNSDSTERLKDKINLESYDKKIVEKLDLSEYLDHLVRSNAESKRVEFYDTLDYLKVSYHFFDNTLDNLKNDFDDAYLKTVLNIKQKKLDVKAQKKIYKTHEKGYKLIKKITKK